MLTTADIRQMFLDYFQEHNHLKMPSSSLIPAGDPTLLLTTAGMVQMKQYFLGQVSPPASRMTSSQKCFRTTDIDLVGDHKHLTFFEMLGNFSVGNYFKEEAIQYAWEFLTTKMNLAADRLWITVYAEDQEAFDFWNKNMSIPSERIYRYGKIDNWWGPPGTEGPCGPCSEIHYDFGLERGCAEIAKPDQIAKWNGQGTQPGCHPNCDNCERFIELWNLVFMQFFQDSESQLTLLPKPNIDTGMGLERAAVILQDVKNVYETDSFQSIITKICDLSNKKYGENHDTDQAIRVVAEHVRGAVFLISDGVIPGNTGRGYVLRRIVRRAVRFGRKIGLIRQFLSEVADTVVQDMANIYGELEQNQGFITRVLSLEEERFSENFERGEEIILGMIEFRKRNKTKFLEIMKPLESPQVEPHIMDQILEELQKIQIAPGISDHRRTGELDALQVALDISKSFLTTSPVNIREKFNELILWPDTISGKEQFKLYDTHGFPPELTEEFAHENGLSLNLHDFQIEMEAHQNISRSNKSATTPILNAKIFQYGNLGILGTRFVGYDTLSQDSVVIGLLDDNESLSEVEKGQEVEVILRETPFYAEGGGQTGDRGLIESAYGKLEVQSTHSPIPDLIVHRVKVLAGKIALGDSVIAGVDRQMRTDAARNHTATHLLHAALRQVLGSHVRQAGSLVAPDRMRFDFTHIQGMTPKEIRDVEDLVNKEIRENSTVSTHELAYTDALQEGALAFFGDKYGEKVRVVEVGCSTDTQTCFSKEVCGGTHLRNTGQMGLFLVTSEGSIGSGIRRIEALTGEAAQTKMWELREQAESLARDLEVSPNELSGKIQSLVTTMNFDIKRISELERTLALKEAEELISMVKEVNNIRVLAARILTIPPETLREIGDYLKQKIGTGVILLGTVFNDRPSLVAVVTSDLVENGYDARVLVRKAAEIIGGGGGGRPDLAQAGGKLPEKIDLAIDSIYSSVQF